MSLASAVRTSVADLRRRSRKDEQDEEDLCRRDARAAGGRHAARLTSHGLPVPDGFAWDDTPETSQFLVEAVKVWPDIAARDRMTANLMASVQLGDAADKQAMFEAAVADGAALAGLTLCASDVHRSFWLYVHHPALFERAYDFRQR